MSNFFWINEHFCLHLDKIIWISFKDDDDDYDDGFVGFRMKLLGDGEREEKNNYRWRHKKEEVLILKNSLLGNKS